jgi:hypothetical protein
MRKQDERSGVKERLPRRFRQGAVSTGKRWIKTGIGPALFLGSVLLLGPIFLRRHAAPRRAGTPLAAPPGPRTAFLAPYAQARQSYLRARIITKGQLEALEEWDPDSIRGSTPEIYRKSLIARTREIGLAEAAAHEAARRAKTKDEVYRAARLLAQIERDLGNHRAEMEQAKKLVALQPHSLEALLMLERAAIDSGDRSLARRAASDLSRMLGSPAGSSPQRPGRRRTNPGPLPSGAASASPRVAHARAARPH